MKVLGYAFAPEDLAVLNGKSEMDAMVAYLLRLGRELKQ